MPINRIYFLVFLQIKKVELKDGQVLFCIWISRDPEDEGEIGVQANLGSSHSSLLLSSVGGIKEVFTHIILTNI